MRILAADIGHGVEDVIRVGVEAAEDRAIHTDKFKDRTGRLRASIVGTYRGYRGKVTAKAPYAKFVHEGTKPHIIAARRAQALSFVCKGVRVFKRYVKHPGTEKRPFLSIAGGYAAGFMDTYAEGMINRAVRDSGR